MRRKERGEGKIEVKEIYIGRNSKRDFDRAYNFDRHICRYRIINKVSERKGHRQKGGAENRQGNLNR